MMRLLQRRADSPDGGGEDGAAGEKQKQTSARRSKAEQKEKKKVLLLLNAQFFIFKGLADENAAAAEVNWAHNGAISCCFVVLLDLANG